MFSRILIASRGEIALRVIRACKELGIQTVCVYSEADAGALYLNQADHKICIGPGESSQSYLNIPHIIAAAEVADADAIHPGYGFLSEVAHFAEVCRDCHLTFIGPSVETLQLMGNKASARQLAKKCGVPIVPGSEGPIETDDQARDVARQVGFPVMIKAARGGGGRGMRRANNEIALMNHVAVARSEAEAAFGNPAVYIEKVIERARHVEVQILADSTGRVVHLGERDCSLQRRHQKLVEEAPCPIITPKLRRRLGDDAVRIATAAKYCCAGTVEFLVDPDGNHYFIEMNCRIQVEHPITEMVTGIDIVREQIQAAAGKKLSFRQEDVKIQGAAIECRINAEDPANNFKPCPGLITKLYWPGGPGVRVDSHAYAGYRIPPNYDSLIAKLIVHRRTREEARLCMRRALEEVVVEGVKTTVPLYLEVFGHSAFVSGRVDTSFIENLEREH
ncbi:MAG TPA: acetyl-CoA carboxylase biotin carboxylase subunit [Planctomycetota bacterium]|nr:acetyl-CoA carboxylase biotin carboxylase subunit [Planctomycetota bacterium]HRR81911.1 acetyl-CoA carboxylase biotin carboxylase subunit [Planctomycetota bacterium]